MIQKHARKLSLTLVFTLTLGVAASAQRKHCSPSIRDAADSQNCIGASSSPQLGSLYPLSNDFNLSALGYVGIGTTNPINRLHVVGSQSLDGLLFLNDRSDGIWFSSIDAGFPMLPMMTMFTDPGSNHPHRMVLAHSANANTWGIEYRDDQDQFVFRNSARDVFTIDLNGWCRMSGEGGTRFLLDEGARLGIGVNLPTDPLHVVGTARIEGLVVVEGTVSVSNDVVAGDDLIAFGEVIANGRITGSSLELTGGGDLVEGFETGEEYCEPGTVVVIDAVHPGQLVSSSAAYDSRVAGVVSGAGDVRHGIRLGQAGVLDGDTLVAMAGRVYVRCTAENGAIQPGDLLTTANKRGHAMKATDRERAWGTVIGKAMSPLENGAGLVLVLVDLQ